MEDCVLINKKLDTKKFSKELNISRVSFASEELFESMLVSKVDAATIFSTIIDCNRTIQVILDKEVLEKNYYRCSDGTNTGYMKIKTEQPQNTQELEL
ncbi:hypothetical protein KGF36_02665 [Clostridioides sp. ZZV14-6009]|uniref:YbaK/EbsC family protein n=1 Tax=unclassified Clostridioides TaxID=2635829 RepID=UPI001D120C12|nr:hypothetical protein [Clostridioides sp. ZZV15-6388]MCC0666186.1 hypothetical protein [Clostridioides sp. ZZV15-6597]MCC0733544.1 hypothetical protein [Clostridioides sp. ZZV14-6009]